MFLLTVCSLTKALTKPLWAEGSKGCGVGEGAEERWPRKATFHTKGLVSASKLTPLTVFFLSCIFSLFV